MPESHEFGLFYPFKKQVVVSTMVEYQAYNVAIKIKI